MLDQNTLTLVKSTAPLLKKHSEAIGKQFYKLLFTKAPELYNIFNQTNQKRGIQQEALAYSVYAAGEHIDNLDAIKPLVRRITEKHRALGVQPEQYPIVGETLIQAVKEVLGQAATADILDAWTAAYQTIADAFIGIEQELYEQTEKQPGGWLGFRDFRVDKIVPESHDVASFYLTPADGQPIPDYKPGQYLTLQLMISGEHYKHVRHYSLSDAPHQKVYRISVKREPAFNKAPEGIVSNYLHQHVKAGDILKVAAPAGDFTLEDDDLPIVLISGGIGLTPVFSMFKTVAERHPDRVMTYIHATRDSTTHTFRHAIGQIALKNERIKTFVCYEKPTDEDREKQAFDKEGHIDLDWLKTILPNNQAHFYFCGPVPFMKMINSALKQWGVPNTRSHYEVFNPLSILEEL
ncbi:flavohemoprotein [Pullulanibacillus camelliae]|uniref:Flavohemoprotein n=1 Tax=Pullulanibacillus camelliae TaxID=1707096 RepID=A0A8J2YNM5_9BACL|nr:NO-inducible flavohemoprotein [Pullulanibacillus camelliae]GGE55494.1 flavohemoprotein [Pullulanibacillus camelliae]